MTQKDITEIPPNKLTDKQAYAELVRLKKLIKIHNQKYHTDASPTISDADYDALCDRNKNIELRFPHIVQNDAPSHTVGGPLAADLTKVAHKVPMLSLTNAYTQEDVLSFLETVQKRLGIGKNKAVTIIAEPKVDGIACSLRYVKGYLVQAATRGDGTHGENITQNVLTIPDIPYQLTAKTVPDVVEVRGEIYMTHKNFAIVNEYQKEYGQRTFSTPRNATSGIIRHIQPQTTQNRLLNFFAYSWGDISVPPDATISNMRTRFKSWGFQLNEPHSLCNSLDEILVYYTDMQDHRHRLSFDIDGLVYKINDVTCHNQLGYIANAPKWAIAHKWPAKQTSTTVTFISFQVNRAGVLTPIAHLTPVTINGTVISRATLHNFRTITEKDIRIGDHVTVRLSGDAIPHIENVMFNKRPTGTTPFSGPKICPCSKEMPIVIEKEGELYRCQGGLDCPPQQIAYLKHATGLKAFNIDKLGAKRIEQFWQRDLLKTPADIFRLHEHADTIQSLPGWGEMSTKTLLDSIEKRRHVDLNRFIYALGIKGIGPAVSSKIAKYYKTRSVWLNSVYFASYARENYPKETQTQCVGQAYAELCAIDGVGMHNADAICTFYSDDANKRFVRDLSNEML